MAVPRRPIIIATSLVLVILLYKLLSHPSFLSVPAVYQKDYVMSPEEQAKWYGYLDKDPSIHQGDGDGVVVPEPDVAAGIAYQGLGDQVEAAKPEAEGLADLGSS